MKMKNKENLGALGVSVASWQMKKIATEAQSTQKMFMKMKNRESLGVLRASVANKLGA